MGIFCPQVGSLCIILPLHGFNYQDVVPLGKQERPLNTEELEAKLGAAEWGTNVCHQLMLS